jgi:hypothetical protein
MKVKHIIVIFLIGIVFMTVGELFKIMHWQGGSMIITISSTLKFIAGLLAIWKVLTMDKLKEFLNS